MADRFKTLSKGVKLSPCVLFDVITPASGPNEGHPSRIVFVSPLREVRLRLPFLPDYLLYRRRKSGASA